MLRKATISLLFLGFTGLAVAGDPGIAIGEARKAIENREYDRAISILQAALPDAADKPEARAAIHFYSALAYWNRGDAPSARSELTKFGEIRRGSNALDPTKYPAAFVRLFNEAAAHGTGAPPQSFEAHYPGFDKVGEPKPTPIPLWGTSAEMQLLASPEEKKEWDRLPDDAARQQFIAKFWAARDPDPATPVNEWRDVFDRRVAFADATFASASDALRGSTTDRGRVFILLGPPSRVFVTTLARRQAGYVDVSGTHERWVYSKDQLPPGTSQKVVEIRFIDQAAYGDHVLERDFVPLHVLAEAKKTLTGLH